MVTLCWAAKGGSGTTVVATALALSSKRPSLLVDLDGEIPTVLGLPDPDRPGINEWVASQAPPSHLTDLLIEISDTCWLLPCHNESRPISMSKTRQGQGHHLNGNATPLATTTAAVSTSAGERRWTELAQWLTEWAGGRGGEVTIDAGTGEPNTTLLDAADRTLLVTRPCYLALRRATQSEVRPTGVVLVNEVGHSLAQRDIEHALRAPVVATVSIDPAVSRAVDAGLLTNRLPRVIERELRRAAA